MALLLHPDGTRSTVAPANGAAFTTDEVYQLLDCRILNVVRLYDGRIMWIDEERRWTDATEPNIRATCLYHKSGGRRFDYVVGRALVCTHTESGRDDNALA